MSRLPYLRSSARLLAVAIGGVVAAIGWAVQAGARASNRDRARPDRLRPCAERHLARRRRPGQEADVRRPRDRQGRVDGLSDGARMGAGAERVRRPGIPRAPRLDAPRDADRAFFDPTCSSRDHRFGFGCLASALGSLYARTLGKRAPDTAVAIASTTRGSFRNFQPYLYWTDKPGAGRHWASAPSRSTRAGQVPISRFTTCTCCRC